MSTTNQSSAVSFGAYIVDLFRVDMDQFQLSAKPILDEHLGRRYELSDLIRHATPGASAP
jgi:hypothetical protein